VHDSERAILQRRIKHQRRELKRLNTHLRALDLLVRNSFHKETANRVNAYRHASQIAESFWFGDRIAKAIRKWC
jgi:hypothetical protein